MKRIYQTAAEASLCCLLSCGVSALPVKPVRIVMHYDVPCLDCAHPLLEGEIGRIIKRADGRVQIVLDPSKPIPQKRFAVAHELGHYLLGHLDRPPEPEDECDADSFADGVLMPLCVLYGVLTGLKTFAKKESLKAYWNGKYTSSSGSSSTAANKKTPAAYNCRHFLHI